MLGSHFLHALAPYWTYQRQLVVMAQGEELAKKYGFGKRECLDATEALVWTADVRLEASCDDRPAPENPKASVSSRSSSEWCCRVVRCSPLAAAHGAIRYPLHLPLGPSSQESHRLVSYVCSALLRGSELGRMFASDVILCALRIWPRNGIACEDVLRRHRMLIQRDNNDVGLRSC